MKHAARRWMCRVLVTATALLPLSGAQAGMIVTDEAAGYGRAAVARVVERADVASQLRALGVDPEAAKLRVAAMTDEEARLLAVDLASQPAGGTSFGLALIAAAIIAAVILYRYR